MKGTGAVHNNKIGWISGEVGDREGLMRGLKGLGYLIIKDTPADRARVNVKGPNKRLAIIQNASREKGEED